MHGLYPLSSRAVTSGVFMFVHSPRGPGRDLFRKTNNNMNRKYERIIILDQDNITGYPREIVGFPLPLVVITFNPLAAPTEEKRHQHSPLIRLTSRIPNVCPPRLQTTDPISSRMVHKSASHSELHVMHSQHSQVKTLNLKASKLQSCNISSDSVEG